MEASAIPASVGLARTRIAIGAPLLRIRSDEQLVSVFRAGNEDAFRVIHDRYRQRMLAYARQMLAGSSADPEDAVQEIFVRAYAGLRANDRQLALRAWLYRIAHNRCIDELRRPQPVVSDAVDTMAHSLTGDPVARVEQRDVLRRLIADVQRLPEQQRSALLMRELGGVTYADMSGALGVSVPAVKSLLVRARVGLAQASEARDAACAEICRDVILSHDRGVRTSGLARRHMRDCPSCRQFRTEVRGVSRQLAALAPTLGPIGIVAKLLGVGVGGAGSGVAGGGGAATASTATTATAATGVGAGAAAGVLASGAGHVATIVAAAVVTAGGAIELQHIGPPAAHHTRHLVQTTVARPAAPAGLGAHVVTLPQTSASGVAGSAAPVPVAAIPAPGTGAAPGSATAPRHARGSSPSVALTQIVDPNQLPYTTGSGAAATTPVTITSAGSTAGTAGSTTTPTATTPAAPGATTPTTPPTTVAGGGSVPAPPASSTPPAGVSPSGSPAPTGAGSSGSPSSTGSAAPAPTGSSTPSSSSATPVSGTTVVPGSAVPATSLSPAGSMMPRRLKIPSHHRHGTIAMFTTAAG